MIAIETNIQEFDLPWLLFYRKFGLKPRPLRTALSYNGKSDNQAKN
ncbi:MAG: hypothetical protein GPJ06_08275 [Microcystis aeruginosa G13-11]|nr:hypothetical protein [Microcystis aeruginosa G13-11]